MPGRVVRLEPFHPRAEHKLIRQFGKLLYLLLPLGFQRSRRDHQHAVGLAKPAEQRAGGDSLDGFAQAHLVGQQCAFGESEVEHPLALIREEGDFGFVRRPFTAVHF